LEFPKNRKILKDNPIKPSGEVLILAGDILLFSLQNNEFEFINYVSNILRKFFGFPETMNIIIQTYQKLIKS